MEKVNLKIHIFMWQKVVSQRCRAYYLTFCYALVSTFFFCLFTWRYFHFSHFITHGKGKIFFAFGQQKGKNINSKDEFLFRFLKNRLFLCICERLKQSGNRFSFSLGVYQSHFVCSQVKSGYKWNVRTRVLCYL